MKTKERKFLIIVITTGTLLRLLALNQHDFWFDETFTYHIAKLPLKELLHAVISDNNPPLYYLFMHLILNISKTEVAMRFPSFLFSLFVIPFIYYIGKLSVNIKTGLIAASLFAVSPLSIYVATEARLHSLGMLIATVSVFIFLKLLKKPSLKLLFLFMSISVLGLYTHYYIALLFLPYTLLIFIDKSKISIKKWLFTCSAIFLSFIPWLILSLFTQHNACSCPSTILSLPATLVSPTVGGIGSVTIRSFPNLPLYLFILLSITAGSILFFFFKGLKRAKHIALIYITPILTLSIGGLLFPAFSPKASAVFSPLYFIIAALGLYRSKTKIIGLVMCLIALVSIIQLINPFFSGDKLKPIYKITKQDKAPVLHTSLLTYYTFEYYSGGEKQQILITQNPLSEKTVQYIGGEKQSIPYNESQIWLIDTQKWVDKAEYDKTLKELYMYYAVEKHENIDTIAAIRLRKK